VRDAAREGNAMSSSEDKPPAAAELSALLGGAYEAFLTLTKRGSGATCEWKRYSKKSPWVLKVSQRDRTLFYVTPKARAFEATVVLGDRATEAALGGRVAKKLHASIRAARRYVEGRPVRVMVRKETDLSAVEELVAVKLNPAVETSGSSSSAERRKAPKKAGR
jgi:hypothetical protein